MFRKNDRAVCIDNTGMIGCFTKGVEYVIGNIHDHAASRRNPWQEVDVVDDYGVLRKNISSLRFKIVSTKTIRLICINDRSMKTLLTVGNTYEADSNIVSIDNCDYYNILSDDTGNISTVLMCRFRLAPVEEVKPETRFGVEYTVINTNGVTKNILLSHDNGEPYTPSALKDEMKKFERAFSLKCVDIHGEAHFINMANVFSLSIKNITY